MRFATVTVLLWVLGYPAQAHAYLDPGTGSMIISAIVGVFATLALAVKTYWYKLVGLFRRKSAEPRGEQPADEASPPGKSDG